MSYSNIRTEPPRISFVVELDYEDAARLRDLTTIFGTTTSEVLRLALRQFGVSQHNPVDYDLEIKIKKRAYEIDPSCWMSYSGSPKSFKRVMDRRRTTALNQARNELIREI